MASVTLGSLFVLGSLGVSAEAHATSVLIIGDSITGGHVSGPPGTPYVTLVADALAPDIDLEVAACGGSATGDWLLNSTDRLCGAYIVTQTNFYRELARPRMEVDLVTILLGTVDTFEDNPAGIYEDNLRNLIGTAFLDGARHVMLIPPPPVSQYFKLVRLGQYRMRILAICGELSRVTCGPDLLNLMDLDDHFEGIDIHPNALGHSFIAEHLTAAIRTVVPETSTGVLLSLGCVLLCGRRPRANGNWVGQERRPRLGTDRPPRMVP